MTDITFGSACSGIEAASVAWELLGWRAAWLSEIELYPRKVLAHYYPKVPNLGNMLAIPAMLRNGDIPAPDVFTGGTPCQAFSVAGLRASLKDARGNLSMTFCEIADEIDIQRAAAGLLPCVIKWENVPGVLSTKDNAFGCFLGGLAGESEALVPEPCPATGKSSRFWKWSKKDGQHVPSWPKCGVVLGPQRAVAWRVLDAQYFGLAQRRLRVFVVASAREGFDPAAVLLEFDGVRRDSAPSREAGQDVAGTLASRTEGGGFPGSDESCSGYVQPVTYAPTISHCLNAGGMGRIDYETEAMIVDRAPFAHAFDASEDGTGRGQPIVAQAVQCPGRVDAQGGSGLAKPGDPMFTLSTQHEPHGVLMGMAVRRLMPIECERLQGFKDGYTLIPMGKKMAADGPRYKALGNSWAVPVVRWIGARIDKALKEST